jgi:hypothetical protein
MVAVWLVLSGCGAAQQTISIPSPDASTATTVPTETSTQTASPASNYPVVSWNNGPWPFTLQVISITKSPEGFRGVGSAPPGHEWLMLRMAVTSQTPDRGTEAPQLERANVVCNWPGSPEYNHDAEDGYEEQVGSNELVLPTSVGMRPNESHTWGAEWEIPENLDTKNVTCTIDGDGLT